MNLEERILKRWKDWWVDKCNPPVDRLLLQLIAIALEEAQKGMCEPRFTVKEAIAVEHALDMLNTGTKPDFPMTPEARLALLRNLVTPEVISALGKLHLELDNIKQAQERNFPGNMTGGKG